MTGGRCYSWGSTLRFVPAPQRRFGIAENVKTAKVAAAASPVWNVIMPAGEWHRKDFPDGKLKCDRGFFEAAIANWKKIGSPGLPINRFHWGSSDDTRVTDPKAKAAVGFIEDLRINADGDLEALTAWNADGKADIEADRFRYISPEFHENWRDAATGDRQGPTLFGAALLNDPYFKTLPRLAANEPDEGEERHVMTREELIEMYGLPKTASDADIKAAALKGAEAVKAAVDADEKRKASEARTGTLEEELREANEAREASDKRIAALEADAKKAAEAKLKADTDALCAKLQGEGRIVASEKDDVALDVRTYGFEVAAARYAKRTPVVKLGEHGIPGDDGGEVSPEAAHKQLEAKAAELVKAGTAKGDAYRVACEQLPTLAAQALKLSKGTENRTH